MIFHPVVRSLPNLSMTSSMSSNMARPVVIVTGASRFDYLIISSELVCLSCSCRGIGLGVTRALLVEYNAIVGAISRSKPAELVQLEQAHGESLKTFQCDMSVDLPVERELL